MMKKILSLFLTLCLLSGLIAIPADAAFTDISNKETALAAAVLQSMGIASGVTSTSYSPDTMLTRAQFCTLAVRAMGLEDSVGTYSYKTLFTDVKPGTWYTGYVNLAYTKGIINGYGNGTFGPEDSVTYGQVATILLRLLGYTSEEVGKVWPTDYVNFAKEQELDKGLSLGAASIVTRGDAARLLYNTIKTEVKGSSVPYYNTISGVSSTETVIALDSDATSGGASGYLMACLVGETGTSIEYYPQKQRVSSDLQGFLGTLLLNSSGKVVGFVPDSSDYVDLTVSSAKASGITDQNGKVYRVTGSATVIVNGSIYTYSGGGFVQVNNRSGKSARLYYDDSGAVSYVYISTGTVSASTEAVVAKTNSAASELARELGITASGYSITKNGGAAVASDLARYDVAYYDAATRTMRVSDYRVTGYIEAAYPSLDSARTITLAGCTIDVLESAWDTLGDYKLGDRVTLFLTDDGKAAAADSGINLQAEMIGVLALDGKSVTLSGSGLVLTADKITASEKLHGTLVRVTVSEKSSLSCYTFIASGAIARVDIAANTAGSYKIAPGCAIYEWAGLGYVYSLSGDQGDSSSNFDEIMWTKTLSGSYVSYYRLNSAGQVDVLLLKEVTGNFYEYGGIAYYSGENGINLGDAASPSYNSAVKITNSSNPTGSQKYLYAFSTSNQYSGIALGKQNSAYQTVTATSKLSAASVGSSAFFKEDGEWFVTTGGYEVPISSKVQVHVSSANNWYGGEDGLLTALSSGMNLTVYYDRSFTTGAQIRLIVIST